MEKNRTDLYAYFGRERAGKPRGFLYSYRHTGSREIAEKKRSAILIFPGGGYSFVSEREWEPVALYYYGRGLDAFVLVYNVAPDCGYPTLRLEAGMAMLGKRSAKNVPRSVRMPRSSPMPSSLPTRAVGMRRHSSTSAERKRPTRRTRRRGSSGRRRRPSFFGRPWTMRPYPSKTPSASSVRSAARESARNTMLLRRESTACPSVPRKYCARVRPRANISGIGCSSPLSSCRRTGFLLSERICLDRRGRF